MKRSILFSLFLLFSLVSMGQTAVLMVHYGTTDDASRAKTLDAINALVHRQTGLEVREAYSSKMVIAALKKRNIPKQTITEALLALRRDGYRKVVVQPTHLLDGIMTNMMHDSIAPLRHEFDTIAIGSPLFSSVETCRQMVEMLTRSVRVESDTEVFYVGHGTQSMANAVYSMLDYMFKEQGNAHQHVVTIEGYPGFDSLRKILQKSDCKHVVLIPLLYIAGNHKSEDLDGEWKEVLERTGYRVEVVQHGLGEWPEVQQFLVGRILHLLK